MTLPLRSAVNPGLAMIASVMFAARASRSDSTGTVTTVATPSTVKVSVQVSPVTTGANSTSSRWVVAACSTIDPLVTLLARKKGLPAFAPSVEMVSSVPLAAAL